MGSLPDGVVNLLRGGSVVMGSVQTPKSTKLIPLPAPAFGPDIFTKSSPTPRAAWQRRYGNGLVVADFLVISAAVVLAQLLRFGTRPATVAGLEFVGLLGGLDTDNRKLGLVPDDLPTRAPGIVGGGSEEFRRVWTATFRSLAVSRLCRRFSGFDIARGYLAIALPFGLVGLTVNRFLARKVVAAMRRRGRLLSAVLAVGEPESVRALAESLHVVEKMVTPS